MNTDPVEYYRRRALEYEAVYHKPERLGELERTTTFLQHTFSGLDVLEIACGTGYWTERIARAAHSVAASDINEAMLDIARSKRYTCPVTFREEDLYRIPPARQPVHYEGLFGGFIWSHIPVQQLNPVLKNLAGRIKPGGTLVFMDNLYVEGSSTPLYTRDADGNTFQQRILGDGSEHLVLKNFPSAVDVHRVLSPFGSVEVMELTYFWLAECKLFSNKNNKSQQ